MKLHLLLISFYFLTFTSSKLFAQNYTSYFTGNPNDVVSQAEGGVCLMGGASEHDLAMKWFLGRANGGDILVLRASGSDGYNSYLYSDLGVSVNSVETIVFNDLTAANENYIHEKIKKAEAIWFAGGDQWDYISFWRNTPIDSLINIGLTQRNIVIGGTSAGMAIQGQYYFTAENGTITSTSALVNPFDVNLTLSNDEFLSNEYLTNTITDTHFDNPNRKGRLVTFLARIMTDDGIRARAIACDEYTAVCIDENGIARSYGDYPNYDEDIYFIQTNCSIDEINPEICQANTPLTWDLNDEALLVYNIKGTNSANNSFDLNDWKTASGGTWKYWSVNAGVLTEIEISNPSCLTLGVDSEKEDEILFNYFIENNQLNLNYLYSFPSEIKLVDSSGKLLYSSYLKTENGTQIDLKNIENGMYFIELRNKEKHHVSKIMILR